MRYESIFAVTFDADTDAEARRLARLHHAQLRDDLLIEGADHPRQIQLRHLFTDGRDILPETEGKQITR